MVITEGLAVMDVHPSRLIIPVDACSTASSFESYHKLDHKILKPWAELTGKERVCFLTGIVLKLILIFGFLYLFICSMDLLALSLRLIEAANPHIVESKLYSLYNYDIEAMMVGIIATTITQSSSTTTAILVGIVAADIMPIRNAIPIIMGTNIGSSLINTVLTLGFARDRNKFHKAFATAVTHDMFNWLTTLVVLPIEMLFGCIYELSNIVVVEFGLTGQKLRYLSVTKFMTGPLTRLVIKVNNTALIQNRFRNDPIGKAVIEKNGHIFANSNWSVTEIGVCVAGISLAVLLVSLTLMVLSLSSLLKGRIAKFMSKTTKPKLPHCPLMTEYFAMLVGALITILFQSSSAFTAMLPALVAERALSSKRAYSLTLGANVGSSAVTIYAAMSQYDSDKFEDGIKLAFCYFFFNIAGVLLFYPVPWTRFPLKIGKKLGKTTKLYPWFAIVYIVILFFIIPGTFVGLSFAGNQYVWITTAALLAFLVTIISINSLRVFPRFLPKCLHSWEWLPRCFWSMEYYDKFLRKCCCCKYMLRSANEDER